VNGTRPTGFDETNAYNYVRFQIPLPGPFWATSRGHVAEVPLRVDELFKACSERATVAMV
jgi:hypothetical protein